VNTDPNETEQAEAATSADGSETPTQALPENEG
jgi:hypothetical protein